MFVVAQSLALWTFQVRRRRQFRALRSLPYALVLWGCSRALAETGSALFPPELVNWRPMAANPVFAAAGAGHWDAKIRERGWIVRDAAGYRLWFTGYDGRRDGLKLLGYATSADGLRWQRYSKTKPLVENRWVEDMTVVQQGGVYYMFAEGQYDNHTEMLTSIDGIDWHWHGTLEVRAADGQHAAPVPCGTPTIWIEDGTWYLMYEWMDRGVWLAKSTSPLSLVWTNVQDAPVLLPGPVAYDRDMIAVDQVIQYQGKYFAIYHGSGSGKSVPRTWNTDIACSSDLVHWTKYSGNPIVENNKSSGELVPTEHGFRLYTMHDQVDAYESYAR